MICKFTCPNGHVLQGLETQLGQKCICPQCEVTFVVQTISPDPRRQSPVKPAAKSYPRAPKPVSTETCIRSSGGQPLVAPAQLPPSDSPAKAPSALPRATPRRAAKPAAAASEPQPEAGLPDFNAEWRSEGFAFDGGGAAQEASAASDAANDFTTPAQADDSTDFLESVSGSRGAEDSDPVDAR